MKKVIVKNSEMRGRGIISWLHKIPADKQYRDIKFKDMSKYGGQKEEPVICGIGFYITDETDPLFLEFREKYPNTTYRIED